MSTAPDTNPPAPKATAVPSTHLNAAIAVTVLCFLPLGVVAIVYALRTADALSDGDLDRAQQAAGRARRWVRIAFVVGLVVWAFLLAIFLLLGAFG